MNSEKPIPFERLCIGMLIVDEDGDEGRVVELDDIHNVRINFTDFNFSLCCLDPSCDDYTPLYYHVAEEYNSDIIDFLDTKQPNPEDYKGDGSTGDYINDLLTYIERIKRDHQIEMEMLSSALEADDKKIKQFEEWVNKQPFWKD